MDVVSRFYAIVDYPDEEIEPLQQAQIEQTLAESAERLDALLATFSRGRLLKSGVPQSSSESPTRASPRCSTPCSAMTAPS